MLESLELVNYFPKKKHPDKSFVIQPVDVASPTAITIGIIERDETEITSVILDNEGVQRALLEVIKEMGENGQGHLVLNLIARQLGIRPANTDSRTLSRIKERLGDNLQIIEDKQEFLKAMAAAMVAQAEV